MRESQSYHWENQDGHSSEPGRKSRPQDHMIQQSRSWGPHPRGKKSIARDMRSIRPPVAPFTRAKMWCQTAMNHERGQILFIHKNSVIYCTMMQLEDIGLNEVSQARKGKLYVLSSTCVC